jgi:hypothetical protein
MDGHPEFQSCPAQEDVLQSIQLFFSESSVLGVNLLSEWIYLIGTVEERFTWDSVIQRECIGIGSTELLKACQKLMSVSVLQDVRIFSASEN